MEQHRTVLLGTSKTDPGLSISLEKLAPTSAIARGLIDELDRYLLSLYPPESNHLDSIDELSQPHVHFLVAFDGGQPFGCGAVKLLDDYAEIKRIFVSPGKRGKGAAQLILSELENIARSASVDTVRLETGTQQPEALRMFERSGYVRTGPFGSYPDDPLSVFMRKSLSVKPA